MSGTPRSPDDDERRDGLALALMRGVGSLKFRIAVERHGDAHVAFGSMPAGDDRDGALARAEVLLERARRVGAEVLLFGDRRYPEPLADLSDPPACLFAIGDVGQAARLRVGIVGTRHSSHAGERTAHRIAGAFVAAGVTVVSGMALGIDAAAHRGAMDAGGGTIAVLGGGADLPYPPSHAALHERITRHGLVLSEAPLGTRPVKGAFPKRNRIIAALSDLLIVVEAGERSGALITARLALELGRSVAAVPGPIDSPRHVGSNRLLATGALFIATPEDALTMMPVAAHGTPPAPNDAGGSEPTLLLSEAELAVRDALSRGASDPDGIARVTGLPAREIGSALAALEVAGVVHTDPSGAIELA